MNDQAAGLRAEPEAAPHLGPAPPAALGVEQGAVMGFPPIVSLQSASVPSVALATWASRCSA